MTILFGSPSTYTVPVSYNVIVCQNLSCQKSGTLNEIRVYSLATGYVKAGLYSNNSGSPDTRLTVNNTGVSCAADQWNSIIVPDISVVEGTNYFLAVLGDSNNVISRNAYSSVARTKAGIYSTGLPDPAGSSYSSSSYQYGILGYGISSGGTGLLLVGGI